jgi:class 3 adenylate cyclase
VVSCKGTVCKTGEIRILKVTQPVNPLPLPKVYLPDVIGSSIRAYVPPGGPHQAERRDHVGLAGGTPKASVLFVNLKSIPLTEDSPRAADPRLAHKAFRVMQKRINHNKGYRRQFLVDDKGLMLIVVFGVPPYAHEDDAYRAIKTSLEIRDALCSVEVEHSIGVATGNVYVGSVGSRRRQEHAVVGDTVNTAARLSGQPSDGGILCDENTFHECADKFKMTKKGVIKVKGKAKFIKIFEPTIHNRLAQMHMAGEIIGRREETVACMQELASLQLGGKGRIIWIEGPPGIGKSSLVRNVYRMAKANVTTCYVAAEATESTKPYALWAVLLEELLQLGQCGSGLEAEAAKRKKILKFIKEKIRSPVRKMAPLLNNLLHLSIPDNRHTQDLEVPEPGTRIRSTFQDRMEELLVAILVALQRKGKHATVWIIEDTHNLDPHSWSALLAAYEHKQTRLMLVMTSRPISAHERCSNHHQRLINMTNPAVVNIYIKGLDRPSLERLLCQITGATTVPTKLLDIVMSRSKGNPLFAMEVAHALQSQGMFFVDLNHHIIVTALGAQSKRHITLSLPTTLKSLLTKRIDSLPPMAMLLVKLASVVGVSFDTDLLQSLFKQELEGSPAKDTEGLSLCLSMCGVCACMCHIMHGWWV